MGNYNSVSTEQLIKLWKDKRRELALREPGECIKEMGQLYKLRNEIEKRLGNTNPTVSINFESYLTD